MKIDSADVRRAYFYAASEREVYVGLPDEDYEEGMCGKLVKSMYGAGDAARNWEMEYAGFMKESGFKQGIACPCVFDHEERNSSVAFRGDDFIMFARAKGF